MSSEKRIVMYHKSKKTKISQKIARYGLDNFLKILLKKFFTVSSPFCYLLLAFLHLNKFFTTSAFVECFSSVGNGLIANSEQGDVLQEIPNHCISEMGRI